MSRRIRPALLALALLLLGLAALAGCGQTGPLTLPDAAAEDDDNDEDENER